MTALFSPGVGGAQTFASLRPRVFGSAVVLAVGIGAIGARAPDRLLLIVLAGAVLFVAVMRPVWVLVALLALYAVIPEGTLVSRGLPSSNGQLKLTDAILLLALARWAIDLRVPGRVRWPSVAVTSFLCGLLILVLGGIVTAHIHGTPLKQALNETRPLLGYLVILPVSNYVRTRRDLTVALFLFVGLLTVSSGVTAARYLTGTHESALNAAGALRIRDAVDVAPLYGLLIAVVLLYAAPRRFRVWTACAVAVNAIALYVTFLRGAWLAAIVGIAFALFLIVGAYGARALSPVAAIAGAAVLMIVGSILLYPSGASELRPASARLGTLVHGAADVSSRHRLAETQEAIRRIEEDPLTGIGLGGTITFVSPLYNEQQQAANVRFSTSYLHNSYTWIALKLGIPALLLLLWIALRSMVRCVRLAASNDRLAHSLTVSGAACLVASVLFSATGPHLTDLNSVPLVAILLALPDVVERITQK